LHQDLGARWHGVQLFRQLMMISGSGLPLFRFDVNRTRIIWLSATALFT